MIVRNNVREDYLQRFHINRILSEDESMNVSLLCVLKMMVKNRGFRAVLLYRIGRYFRIHKHNILASAFERLIHRLCLCEISTTADIGPGFSIFHPFGLVVGDSVRAGKNLILSMDAVLGRKRDEVRNDGSTGPIIGDNVHIASGSKLCGIIHIGDNCSIGVNSVLTSDFPSDCIIAGAPARIIERNGQKVDFLEQRGKLSEILKDLLGRIEKLEQQIDEAKKR